MVVAAIEIKLKGHKLPKVVSKYTLIYRSSLMIILEMRDPATIRKTLIKNSSNPIEVPNRRDAIKFGIKYLKENDGILIIAGKGHEETTNLQKINITCLMMEKFQLNYAKNL